MTKKDYELIAAAIESNFGGLNPAAHAFDAGASTAVKACALALADALSTTTPQFDRAWFLAACGVAA